LTPSATYNTSMPQPLTVPGVHKWLHYPKETKHNDNLESPLRGHSCYCNTYVHSQYSECPSPSYREMDTSYRNHHSIPKSRAPKSLTEKRLREGLYMSIPRRMTITLINEGVFPCPNEYWTLYSLKTTFPQK